MFYRPIVCVAHPGHELRIWGWIQRLQPQVHVLTDGSGHTAIPRIQETRRLLEKLGASPGDIFGESTDKEIYAAILQRQYALFGGFLNRLVAALVAANADAIIGDPYEGFNPSHDICRELADAAAAIASRKMGHEVRSYDFTLTPTESGNHVSDRRESLSLALEDAPLAEKLRAAQNFRGLEDETRAAIEKFGPDSFRNEPIRQLAPRDLSERRGPHYYERVGQERVQAGVYATRIGFGEHVEPLLQYIRAHV